MHDCICKRMASTFQKHYHLPYITGKMSTEKMSLRKCPMGKCPMGNCPKVKCPKVKCPMGKCPMGNCRLGNCPMGNCRLGNCPKGKCPMGKCPMGNCRLGNCQGTLYFSLTKSLSMSFQSLPPGIPKTQIIAEPRWYSNSQYGTEIFNGKVKNSEQKETGLWKPVNPRSVQLVSDVRSITDCTTARREREVEGSCGETYDCKSNRRISMITTILKMTSSQQAGLTKVDDRDHHKDRWIFLLLTLQPRSEIEMKQWFSNGTR